MNRIDLSQLGNSQYLALKRGTFDFLGGQSLRNVTPSGQAINPNLVNPSNSYMNFLASASLPDDFKDYLLSNNNVAFTVFDNDTASNGYSDKILVFNSGQPPLAQPYTALGAIGGFNICYVKKIEQQTANPSNILIYEISYQSNEADPVQILGNPTSNANIHKFIMGFYNTDFYSPSNNSVYWGGVANFSLINTIPLNNITSLNDNRFKNVYNKLGFWNINGGTSSALYGNNITFNGGGTVLYDLLSTTSFVGGTYIINFTAFFSSPLVTIQGTEDANIMRFNFLNWAAQANTDNANNGYALFFKLLYNRVRIYSNDYMPSNSTFQFISRPTSSVSGNIGVTGYMQNIATTTLFDIFFVMNSSSINIGAFSWQIII